MNKKIIASFFIIPVAIVISALGLNYYISNTNRGMLSYKERKVDVVSSTRENTLDESSMMQQLEKDNSGVYNETEEWSTKYPDKKLPDLINIDKDVYGNYIITEDMFNDPATLPLSVDGYIEYINFYDDNGRLLNPMPSYYNDYLQYFEQSGG